MTKPITKMVWLIWRKGRMTVHSTDKTEAEAIYARMKADRLGGEVILARGVVTEIKRSPE